MDAVELFELRIACQVATVAPIHLTDKSSRLNLLQSNLPISILDNYIHVNTILCNTTH